MCDNASIHKREDMLQLLDPILRFKGIRLVYIPKYSPELNPVEQVWAVCKNWLRNYRMPHVDLKVQIKALLDSISHTEVFNFYVHCILNFLSEWNF